MFRFLTCSSLNFLSPPGAWRQRSETLVIYVQYSILLKYANVQTFFLLASPWPFYWYYVFLYWKRVCVSEANSISFSDSDLSLFFFILADMTHWVSREQLFLMSSWASIFKEINFHWWIHQLLLWHHILPTADIVSGQK